MNLEQNKSWQSAWICNRIKVPNFKSWKSTFFTKKISRDLANDRHLFRIIVWAILRTIVTCFVGCSVAPGWPALHSARAARSSPPSHHHSYRGTLWTHRVWKYNSQWICFHTNLAHIKYALPTRMAYLATVQKYFITAKLEKCERIQKYPQVHEERKTFLFNLLVNMQVKS